MSIPNLSRAWDRETFECLSALDLSFRPLKQRIRIYIYIYHITYKRYIDPSTCHNFSSDKENYFVSLGNKRNYLLYFCMKYIRPLIMQVLWKDKKRQQWAYSLLQKNSRQTFMMNDCCNYTCQKVCDVLSQGQSINNVTHFLRFFTLPSSLSPILLNRLME